MTPDLRMDDLGSESLARLNRLAHQFLVHSFLYYRLGETLLTDAEFDRLADELRALRSQMPAAPMAHAQIVDPALGPEASGYRIKDYPPPIITTAFQLLYQHLHPPIAFPEFVERLGYRVHEQALV